MRFILTSFVLLIATTIWASTDSLNVKRKDSLSEVSITPYFKRDKASLSNYLVLVNSRDLLKFSSGINITNALRGSYPGLNIPAYAPNAMNSFQTYVLDGVVMNGSLSNYLSLNSFDYQGISATRSGNALTILDQAAEGGAFILTSQSGKGAIKPSFEFNSYNTYGFRETTYSDFLTGNIESKKINDFNFSESLAYSQDFGKVDLRVSYNLNSNHNSFYNDTSVPDTHLNRFKINAGFNLLPKLSMRLIADGSLFKYKKESNSFFGRTEDEAKRSYYQANFSVNYAILKELNIVGQVFYGSLITNNSSKNLDTSASSNSEGNLKLINPVLALHFNKAFGVFSIMSSAGFNYRRSIKDRSALSNGIPGSATSDMNSQSYFVNSLFDFKKRIFLDGNWRSTQYSTYPSPSKNKNNYAISASGIIFKSIANDAVSNFRLRSSYGESFSNPLFEYPFEFVSSTGTLDSKSNHKKKEAGLDVSFLKEKLGLSFNYFNSISENPFSWTFPPSSGFVFVQEDFKLINTGYETILNIHLINSKNFWYDSRVIWSQYKTKVEIPGSSSSGSGNSSKPWSGSLWNMMGWKNLSAMIILETQQNVMTYSFSGNMPTIMDVSWVKLRDVSIGYTFLFKNLKLQQCYLSLTGRNLWSSIDYEKDPEVLNQVGGVNGSFYNVQKSVTLNLALSF